MTDQITKNKKKILVTDDDQEIVEQIRHALFLHLECTIHSVFNGKEAIDRMEKELPYDLLILDILLPKLNGVEVCQYMMRNEKLKKIPVLLISILPLDSTAFQKSLKIYGEFRIIRGVLQKPFANEALVAQVKDIIGTSKKKYE